MEQFFSQYQDVALENLKLQIVRDPDTDERSEQTAFLVDFLKHEERGQTACIAEAAHQAA